jgi:hypothetical protein
VRDSLSGNAGLDWFLAGDGDRVADDRAPEIVTSESSPGAMTIDWSPSATALASSALGDTRSSRWVPEFTLVSEAESELSDDLGVIAL